MNKSELCLGNYVSIDNLSGYKVVEICENVLFLLHEEQKDGFSVRYDHNRLTGDTDFERFFQQPEWNIIVSEFGMVPYQYSNNAGICLFFDKEENICYMTMFPHYKIKYVHTLQNLLCIAYPNTRIQECDHA